MFIIAFNGPPRSGKDTLAQFVLEALQVEGHSGWIRSLSMPMRRRAFATLGLDYTDDYYEAIKDEIIPLLGVTLRQFMIDDSQQFMKPIYGQAIWSKILMAEFNEKALAAPGILLIPDLGFLAEAGHLSDAVGPNNFYLVRTAREGCDFSRDSRNYVNWSPMGTFVNNGSLNDWRDTAGSIVWRLRNRLHWF